MLGQGHHSGFSFVGNLLFHTVSIYEVAHDHHNGLLATQFHVHHREQSYEQSPYPHIVEFFILANGHHNALFSGVYHVHLA